MERPSWVQQVYGYAVCLVAIITLLIGVSNFVRAAIERSAPLQAQGRFGGPESLSSFEAYRATYNRYDRPTRVAPPGSPDVTDDTLSTAELRARYEALRADRLAQVSFDTRQRMAVHGLLVLLAAVLFATHWTWLRRRGGSAAS